MSDLMNNPMPKVSQLGQVAVNHLDVPKLIEAARSKLSFARQELDRIKRDHAMKMVEIGENARQKMEMIQQETREAIRILDEQTRAAAEPAKDMIKLVESMLDYNK